MSNPLWGANVIDKIDCKNKIANDANKYLIALLSHVQQKRPLLEGVSRELYSEVKGAYKRGDTSMYADWYVGNIGFLASFNGKWFDGGFAKIVYEKTKNGLRLRDYYREGRDNLLNQSDDLFGIVFLNKDYRDLELPSKSLVYCDPPYRHTTKYANSKGFDHEEFWEWVRTNTTNDRVIIVSELDAPKDFTTIWEQEVVRSLNPNKQQRATEKLFIYQSSK